MGIIDGQARDFVDITESDTVPINPTVISIYVGGTGNLVVVSEAKWDLAKSRVNAANPTAAQIIAQAISDSLFNTFNACPVGFVLNGRIAAVLTATTATLLTGYLP